MNLLPDKIDFDCTKDAGKHKYTADSNCIECKHQLQCLNWTLSWEKHMGLIGIVSTLLLGIPAFFITNPDHKTGAVAIVLAILVLITTFYYRVKAISAKKIAESLVNTPKCKDEKCPNRCKGSNCNDKCKKENCDIRKIYKLFKKDLDYEIIEEFNNFEKQLNETERKYIFKSRIEFLTSAKKSRKMAQNSYHVLYLTNASLSIYLSEGNDWIKTDKNTAINSNRRIIIVDDDDFKKGSEKNNVYRLLVQLKKTSSIKVFYAKNVQDFDHKLLKDFGLFSFGGDVYHGFFTMADFKDITEVKYLYGMTNSLFIKLERNCALIEEYKTLFNNAWNAVQGLQPIPIERFKVKRGNLDDQIKLNKKRK